jgi:hypothetical protein
MSQLPQLGLAVEWVVVRLCWVWGREALAWALALVWVVPVLAWVLVWVLVWGLVWVLVWVLVRGLAEEWVLELALELALVTPLLPSKWAGEIAPASQAAAKHAIWSSGAWVAARLGAP